ncbi:MAG: class I SAM-dependent methyltransferase [Candidatus Binatia bacterium]
MTRLESLEACELCGRNPFEGDYLFSSDGFDLERCPSCGLVATNPRPTREAISRYYPKTYYAYRPDPLGWGSQIQGMILENLGGYPAASKRPLMVRIAVRALSALLGSHISYVLPYTERKGKLLDIGCGSGHFLSSARSLGWDTYGVEIDPGAAHLAIENGHTVAVGCGEELDYPGRFFDAVTLLQVLEHCHSPMNALLECRRVIKPTGVLIVSTPNFACGDREMFLDTWRNLDCPNHLFHFTPDTLVPMLANAGFKTNRVAYKALFCSPGSRESFRRLREKLRSGHGLRTRLPKLSRAFLWVYLLKPLQMALTWSDKVLWAQFITTYATPDTST